MKTPLQITFRGMDPSDAIELAIREKARRLEHFFPRITRCHVTALKTCRTSSSVTECARTMAEHDIGFLPVVDESGRLLGVVTDRDLAVRVSARIGLRTPPSVT